MRKPSPSEFAVAAGPFRRAALAAAVLAVSAVAARAQEPAADGDQLASLGSLLAQLLVVALITESALASLFQWRVYRMAFNHRATKTPVMWVVGLAIVIGFDFDVFARAMAAISGGAPAAWAGSLSAALSAGVIAGGSAGVNGLLVQLGLRSPLREPPPPAPKDDGVAWFSVRVAETTPPRPVEILVAELRDAAPGDLALVGSIGGQPFLRRLASAFGPDRRRFPEYGGREVAVGKVYRIVVRDGAQGGERVVYEGAFGPRAVVDFDVS